MVYFTLDQKLEKKNKVELEITYSWFQTREKMQFIKLDISNWRIGKFKPKYFYHTFDSK